MSARTALVTGGTGFIGRHLIPALVDQQWRAVALVRSSQRAAILPDDARLVPVVLHDTPDLRVVFETHQPDVVIHLATHFVARHSTVAEVASMVAANVGFGTDVAQAAANAGVPIVSASSVWQHHNGAPYDPVSLYAATKQALDDILSYYSTVEHLGWTRLILGDTYGPGDDRGKLLTHLLNAAAGAQPMQASSGRQLWEAVHVRDVVAAFLQVAVEQIERQAARQYQLRPLQSLTVRDVAQVAEEAIGRPVPVDWGARPDRGREMLTPWVVAQPPPGWVPSMDLRQGIAEIWGAEYT
jgi:nucleoside-diphosphate-sugar epimerase